MALGRVAAQPNLVRKIRLGNHLASAVISRLLGAGFVSAAWPIIHFCIVSEVDPR